MQAILVISGLAKPQSNCTNYCKPGKSYCGTQLQKMGYTNTRSITLYECDNDFNGRVRRDCVDGNGCVEHGDYGGFCSIEYGFLWKCGWELKTHNFPVEDLDEKTSYERVNATSVKVDQACKVRCSVSGDGDRDHTGRCQSDTGSSACSSGGKFCGFDLYSLSDKIDWKPYSVYDCTDGRLAQMKEVEACPASCSNGACINDTMASRPDVCGKSQ